MQYHLDQSDNTIIDTVVQFVSNLKEIVGENADNTKKRLLKCLFNASATIVENDRVLLQNAANYQLKAINFNKLQQDDINRILFLNALLEKISNDNDLKSLLRVSKRLEQIQKKKHTQLKPYIQYKTPNFYKAGQYVTFAAMLITATLATAAFILSFASLGLLLVFVAPIVLEVLAGVFGCISGCCHVGYACTSSNEIRAVLGISLVILAIAGVCALVGFWLFLIAPLTVPFLAMVFGAALGGGIVLTLLTVGFAKLSDFFENNKENILHENNKNVDLNNFLENDYVNVLGYAEYLKQIENKTTVSTVGMFLNDTGKDSQEDNHIENCLVF